MIVFICFPDCDIDHLVPIAESLQQDRSIEVKFLSRVLTPNFDFEKTLAVQASKFANDVLTTLSNISHVVGF